MKRDEKSEAIAVFEDIVRNCPKTPEAKQASIYLSKLKKPQKKTK